jgi:hypothetical protein
MMFLLKIQDNLCLEIRIIIQEEVLKQLQLKE